MELTMVSAIDILIEVIIKTMLKGSVKEFTTRTQAELYMFTLDSTAARMGCIKPRNQPITTLTTVWVVVKPYL